jgi:hypothetical protein
MIIGDLQAIDLGVSSFEDMITSSSLYIDKSMFIEHFLNERPKIQLIARQRRLGKSLNLDMLRCFLTNLKDYRPLFKGLFIQNSSAWRFAYSAPVFLLDFKNLDSEEYVSQIRIMIKNFMYNFLDDPKCTQFCIETYNEWTAGRIPITEGIQLLTKIVYTITGKKSYILIDEYDKLLMDNVKSDSYDKIHKFMTLLLSTGLKGNEYLEKGLLTGVMRISYESMLSGLNNLQTYDVFKDKIYTTDYGLTESEVLELSKACGFDVALARQWYNGIKIDGHAIYNTYGVMSMIHHKEFDCYWATSGTMEAISSIMNAKQKRTIIELLDDGEKKLVDMEEKISPKQLLSKSTNSMFYSLLVQSGYLSLEQKVRTVGKVTIPNLELKEVWQRFLLSSFFEDSDNVDPLFLHIQDPTQLATEFETFLSLTLESLSYHDLPKTKSKDGKLRVHENNYHILLYAILASGRDKYGYDSIRSNRESGDGRYDILVEFEEQAVVFEIKSAADDDDLETLAQIALKQIASQRYGADLGKPVTGIGCAFRKKSCKVVADVV